MKKGFTLIELLAVLTILSIIAFIAVPYVLNTIKDAKQSSEESSKNLYIDAVVNTITSKDALENFEPIQCQILSSNVTVDEETYTKGDLLCDGITYVKIKTTGKRPSSGTIKFKDGKVIESTINYD